MKAGSKWIIVAYGLFFCFTNWPILYLVNRIEPKICHIPFVAAWMLFWSSAIGLFHLWYGLARVRDPRVPRRADIDGGDVGPAPAPPDAAAEEGGPA